MLVHPQFDPVALHLGPVQIHWYGLTYLVAFGLGVANSVFEPLAARGRNPVTAVALIGASISGVMSLGLILHAMVNPTPLA